MKDLSTHIVTASGLLVDPIDLDPADVVIEDIAHHLSNQARFTGATKSIYTVAEHSVRVASFLASDGFADEVVLAGLLHDAPEYVLVDLPLPLKNDERIGWAYRSIEADVMRSIETALGVDVMGYEDVWKVADRIIAATEWRDLVPRDAEPMNRFEGVEPRPYTIEPWSPEEARERFLDMYAELRTKRYVAVDVADDEPVVVSVSVRQPGDVFTVDGWSSPDDRIAEHIAEAFRPPEIDPKVLDMLRERVEKVISDDEVEAMRETLKRNGVDPVDAGMTSETILEEADRLVATDRQADYGHPLDDFSKVVGMALALWGRGPQTEEEHAVYMVLVKLAREANRPKRDNRVDAAGYLKTLDLVIEERARREAAE